MHLSGAREFFIVVVRMKNGRVTDQNNKNDHLRLVATNLGARPLRVAGVNEL